MTARSNGVSSIAVLGGRSGSWPDPPGTTRAGRAMGGTAAVGVGVGDVGVDDVGVVFAAAGGVVAGAFRGPLADNRPRSRSAAA